MDKIKAGLVVGLILVGAGGIFLGGALKQPETIYVKQIDQTIPDAWKNDPQIVIAKLNAISRQRGRADADIFIWADGTYNLSVTLSNYSEIKGRGATLKDAVNDMISTNDTIRKGMQ